MSKKYTRYFSETKQERKRRVTRTDTAGRIPPPMKRVKIANAIESADRDGLLFEILSRLDVLERSGGLPYRTILAEMDREDHLDMVAKRKARIAAVINASTRQRAELLDAMSDADLKTVLDHLTISHVYKLRSKLRDRVLGLMNQDRRASLTFGLAPPAKFSLITYTGLNPSVVIVPTADVPPKVPGMRVDRLTEQESRAHALELWLSAPNGAKPPLPVLK